VFGLLDNRTGKISALSVVVVIEDTEGKALFVDGGGLSLTSRITGGDRFEDLPADSLFGNPRRNASSVQLALAALTRPVEKK
jgi:hypothetical protein